MNHPYILVYWSDGASQEIYDWGLHVPRVGDELDRDELGGDEDFESVVIEKVAKVRWVRVADRSLGYLLAIIDTKPVG